MNGKKTGGQLSPTARNILLIEERYAGGDALLSGFTIGLFSFNMMLEPEGITKFLVGEICFFCMEALKQGPYQAHAVRLLCAACVRFLLFSK